MTVPDPRPTSRWPPELLTRETWQRSPILFILVVVVIVNFVAFAATVTWIGGDSLGTKPSVDGFVLKSHGHRTPVSESVWLFSLIHTYLTMAAMPAVMIAFCARNFWRMLMASKFRWFIVGGTLFFAVLWYRAITISAWASFWDWHGLRR